MLFETGLQTRYYLDRGDVDFGLLELSDTSTACPYKGGPRHLSFVREDRRIPDIAWSYDFPTYQLSPIVGLVAFYNEKTDISISPD